MTSDKSQFYNKHCSKCNYSDNPLDTNHIAKYIPDYNPPHTVEFIGDWVFYQTSCGLTSLCEKKRYLEELKLMKKRDKLLDKYFKHVRSTKQEKEKESQ